MWMSDIATGCTSEYKSAARMSSFWEGLQVELPAISGLRQTFLNSIRRGVLFDCLGSLRILCNGVLLLSWHSQAFGSRGTGRFAGLARFPHKSLDRRFLTWQNRWCW